MAFESFPPPAGDMRRTCTGGEWRRSRCTGGSRDAGWHLHLWWAAPGCQCPLYWWALKQHLCCSSVTWKNNNNKKHKIWFHFLLPSRFSLVCVVLTRSTTATSWPSTPLFTQWKRSCRLFRGSSPTRREPWNWCQTLCWRRKHWLMMVLLKEEMKKGKNLADNSHLSSMWFLFIYFTCCAFLIVPKAEEQKQIKACVCVSAWQDREPGPAAERRDEGGNPGQRLAASRRQKCGAHPADCKETHHLVTEEHRQAAAKGAGGKQISQKTRFRQRFHLSVMRGTLILSYFDSYCMWD